MLAPLVGGKHLKHKPFTVHRSPFTVHRSPLIVYPGLGEEDVASMEAPKRQTLKPSLQTLTPNSEP